MRRKNAELFGADLPVDQQVRRIIDDVRRDGDAALSRYTKAFTGAEFGTFDVPRREFEAAYDQVERPLVEALEAAAESIRADTIQDKIDILHHILEFDRFIIDRLIDAELLERALMFG